VSSFQVVGKTTPREKKDTSRKPKAALPKKHLLDDNSNQKG
jgi:hypothetical protein